MRSNKNAREKLPNTKTWKGLQAELRSEPHALGGNSGQPEQPSRQAGVEPTDPPHEVVEAHAQATLIDFTRYRIGREVVGVSDGIESLQRTLGAFVLSLKPSVEGEVGDYQPADGQLMVTHVFERSLSVARRKDLRVAAGIGHCGAKTPLGDEELSRVFQYFASQPDIASGENVIDPRSATETSIPLGQFCLKVFVPHRAERAAILSLVLGNIGGDYEREMRESLKLRDTFSPNERHEGTWRINVGELSRSYAKPVHLWGLANPDVSLFRPDDTISFSALGVYPHTIPNEGH